MSKAVDFVTDIYEYGITKQIIDKYKDSFNEFTIVIHEDDKFIQVNESVIRFNETLDSAVYCIFTTTKDFPDNNSLALICDNYSEFYDFVVFELSRADNSGKILDGLRCRPILESMFPKEGIFYIYNNDLIVDSSSMRNVYLSDGNYSNVKNVTPNSEMLHTVFWSKYMIQAYPELQGKNYLSIPRGRVIYGDNKFVILIDKSFINNNAMKSKIEKEFKLSKSRISIEYIENPHYDYTKYS